MNDSEIIIENDIKSANKFNYQLEIGSPSVGPYISPTFNQDNFYNDKIYGTMVCYNCLSVLLIRNDWNYARCGECQKINKIPHKLNSSVSQFNIPSTPSDSNTIKIYNDINIYESPNDNDLIGDIPYVYGIVNCPYCTTENKIRREAKRITCYHCGNSFSVNGYSNMKKQNYLSKSVPKMIKYREFVPVSQNNHNCNCNHNYAQLLMMNKILQSLKEKKKPLIAFPTIFNDPFGFYYRDLIENNYNNNYENKNNSYKMSHSLSTSKPNLKKESESNGFKITIRKKNKNDNGEDRLSKSDVFEKVFFTNRLKDDFNKDNK